jgi:outer membrane protein TolC
MARRMEEARAKRKEARSYFFPQLRADAALMHRNDTPVVEVGAGSLGTIPGLGPFPTGQVNIGQGDTRVYLQNLALIQPITPLFKIHHGTAAASAEERAAEAKLRKMEEDIAYKTRQVYAGLLIAKAQYEAAEAGVRAAEARDQDAQEAVKAGNALAVVQTGSRALLLQSRQKRLAAEASLADLTAELNDLTDNPQGTALELVPFEPRAMALPSKDVLLDQAVKANPDLASATATAEKSRSGLRAAKADCFIPDIYAFASQTHIDGVDYLRHNSTTTGLALSWTIFDGGHKAYVISERAALVSQATENQRRLRQRVEIDLGKLMRKVETFRLQADTAGEAFALRKEEARLAENQLKAGTISAARRAEIEAAAKAANADHLAAKLGLDLAYAELDQLLGRH